MKRILLLLILSSFGAASLAQTLVNGDYRTAKTSGNWSDADMWETRSAGVWAITATAPSAANNVYVQAGHTVTVDAANVYCKDLQLSTTGSLAIGGNVVNVSGKLRAFNNPAVVGVSDGVYTTNSTSLAAAMIVTSGGGVLKFVGGTRTITATGEWGNATTGNAVEFALNPGAVGTIVTGVKFRPILISSGTVVSDGLCSSGSGDFTIKSGATFKSTRSGGVLWNSSTSKMATLTIETGATLELSGNSPTIDATTIVNNGTVLYSGTSQNLVTKSGTNADGAALFQDYYDLKLSNSGTKQLPSFNVKVANSLTTEGTSSISNTSNSTKIVMANNSSIYRNSTGSIGSTTIEFGASPTDVVNVSVGAAVSAAGELVSSPSPGTIGNLTITPSGVYTITSSRNINDLVNNGLLVLNPTTTMTITINGDISGAGSITGNESASLNFAGMNPNNAGVLKFTTGSQLLNNLTITRGGVNASVSLGTSLTLNGNLNLTNGSLHIQPGQALTISGVNNISGAPFSSAKYINTQVSGASVGKLIITNLSTSKIIPVGHNGNYLPATLTPTVASDFEVNVFVGATANATPNGTALTAAQKLRMVDAVWNINRISGTGNVDLTLGWENALEGADFSTFANAQIGIAGYTAGNYGMFTGTGDAGANTATLTTSTFSPFVVGEANTTLPLTLISFTAKESLNSVKLAWQTTDEVNLKNYVLQHRKGNDFEDIYTVAANNKAGIFNYSYTHLNPTAGTNYYRLVGVDFDGSKQTSNPIPVIVTLGNEVTVYPNPVTQKNISVSGAIKGDVIRILNIQGQVVFTKIANGNQVEEIEVQNFQAGTYILSIENAGKVTATKKLIKI